MNTPALATFALLAATAAFQATSPSAERPATSPISHALASTYEAADATRFSPAIEWGFGGSDPAETIAIDDGEVNFRDQLPQLSELLTEESLNPNGVVLPELEKELLNELLNEQSQRLQDLYDLLSEEMNAITCDRVASGNAERYEANKTDMSQKDYVAVDLVVIEGEPWVVRLKRNDVPNWGVITNAINEIKRETIDQVSAMVEANA